jgi:hypothetical protein|tara:strand:+ start:3713 stop:4057 length:345 start_codon:yes stop_codon:yes gene_type:complete
MPVADRMRRLLLDTIASNINELTIGFDGTPSTNSDGAAGKPALTVAPTVKVIDDTTLLVEAFIPKDFEFTESIKEVFIQYRGTSSFTPVARHTVKPIIKTSRNELRIQVLIEVR